MEATTQECTSCKRTADEARLEKCPICFRWFCDDCAYTMSGRRFCTQFCAEYFFFSEPDD